MADTLTPEQRSRTMRAVKGKDTKPEMIVRRLLHAMGYRFRLHRKDLPGKPDIVLPRHRKIILVHGCFWHGHTGCRRAVRPSSNRDFWDKKIDRNMARDTQVVAVLEEVGWRVFVLWECQTHDRQELARDLLKFMAQASV